MKIILQRVFFFCILSCLLSFTLTAQNIQRQKIAIFTPLYLDSVFDAINPVRFERNDFPRYALAGLDFYHGVSKALDSLRKRGAPLEVFVYDSRGKQPVNQQLDRPEFSNMGMIIAQSNSAETKALADAALQRKIPFISATLPNDVGISNNPYVVLLNSTLLAHVEGLYKFIQKYHSNDKIIFFTKPGAQEDQLKEHFMDFTKSTTSNPLTIKYVNIGSNFTPEILAAHLDSNRRNICIAGTLDETFGERLTARLASINSTYPTRVIGMPTWERMNFNKVQDLEIIYTSPFYYNRSSNLEKDLADAYTAELSNKPSDMFFRGYETVLRFALLLLDTKKDVSSSLTRKGNTVFTQFDIQPVFKDKSGMTLDYFENRHLYFIKAFGGVKNIIQ
jgi:hypothetical protein